MANNPSLSLPASEQVTSRGTAAVAPASYSDGFAASNPGAMYLGITDTSGGLQGYYPASGSGSGMVAAGNNSNMLTFQGSYADINDILNSLTYVAGAAGERTERHHPRTDRQ